MIKNIFDSSLCANIINLMYNKIVMLIINDRIVLHVFAVSVVL